MRRFRLVLPVVAALAPPFLPESALAQSANCGAAEPVGTASVAQPILMPPPPLPEYEQPPIPAAGSIWTPGYWAWGADDYYWVPGTWVQPPAAGLLWTPGYWGWFNGAYIFSPGYWGARVGFYGGINYGFGYTGVGYQGGYWDHGMFNYNRAVNNFGRVQITNVYNKTVVSVTTINRVSYNGDTGGIVARPTASEIAALHDHRDPPTEIQIRHVVAARSDPALRLSVNHGRPAIAATPRPGEFRESVIPAQGASPAVEAHPAPSREQRPPAATGVSAGAEVRPSPAPVAPLPPAVPAHPPAVVEHSPATSEGHPAVVAPLPSAPSGPPQPHIVAAPHLAPARPPPHPERPPMPPHPAPHPPPHKEEPTQ